MATKVRQAKRAEPDWHPFEKTFILSSWVTAEVVTDWVLGIVNDPYYGPRDSSAIYAYTYQAGFVGSATMLHVELFVRADQAGFDWTAVHIPSTENVGEAVKARLPRGFAMIGYADGKKRGWTMGLQRRSAKPNREHVWEYRSRKNYLTWIPAFLNTHAPATTNEIVGMMSQVGGGGAYYMHVWCRRNEAGSTRWGPADILDERKRRAEPLRDRVLDKVTRQSSSWRGLGLYFGHERDSLIAIRKGGRTGHKTAATRRVQKAKT